MARNEYWTVNRFPELEPNHYVQFGDLAWTPLFRRALLIYKIVTNRLGQRREEARNKKREKEKKIGRISREREREREDYLV